MDHPEICYALLCSHRSGSTLLSNLLSQTEVAGKPGEFFSHWNGRSYKNFDFTDYPAYINRVLQESRTSNGVFGVKVMTAMDGFQGVLQKLEAFPTYEKLSDTEKIRTFFPNIKFVYLTRRNKVHQAISWWKAAQNDHYHTTETASMPDTPLEYNFDAITHLLKEVSMEECAHQEFLAMMDAVPLTVVYEDFIQDMEGTVQRIIDFLGIKEDYTYLEPKIFKMADDLTEEWAQRYRKEVQDGWQNVRW